MEQTVIILGSVTYAMKAKELLLAQGISAYIERSRSTKEFGCGYGLHVPKRTDEAEAILHKNQIKILARVPRESKS